jgi:hypothetical protein
MHPAADMHLAKEAAVAQWSADPCGPETGSATGSLAYFRELDAGRRDYAPWMAEVLPYEYSDGKRVLDVGCGQGIDLIRYARHGANVTGIDLISRRAMLNSHGIISGPWVCRARSWMEMLNNCRLPARPSTLCLATVCCTTRRTLAPPSLRCAAY